MSKLVLSWDSFVQSTKCMSLKFTEESCVMAMKNDAKFEKELTSQCLCFQKWRGISQFFARALSLKIGTFMTSFCQKLKMQELKIYREVMCHDNEEWCKIGKGIDFLFQNWHEEFDEFWPSARKSQKFAL